MPSLRPTADLPWPAAALEIRAAFSLESPCFRRSWYSPSLLIDGFGMIVAFLSVIGLPGVAVVKPANLVRCGHVNGCDVQADAGRHAECCWWMP